MEYSSVQELNNLQKQYEQQINGVLDSFSKKLSQSLKYLTEKELKKQQLNHEKTIPFINSFFDNNDVVRRDRLRRLWRKHGVGIQQRQWCALPRRLRTNV